MYIYYIYTLYYIYIYIYTFHFHLSRCRISFNQVLHIQMINGFSAETKATIETRTTCEIWSKPTIKAPERRQWRLFGVFQLLIMDKWRLAMPQNFAEGWRNIKGY